VFDDRGRRVGGAQLLAVVTLKAEHNEGNYRLATESDYVAVWRATRALEKLDGMPLQNGLTPIPDERLPPIGTLGFECSGTGCSIGAICSRRGRRSL